MHSTQEQTQPADSEIGALIGLLQAMRFDELDHRTRMLIVRYPGYGLLYKIFGAAKQMRSMDCLSELLRAALLLPGDIELYSNLGNLLHMAGQASEANDTLQRALIWEPAYAYAHYNLGLLLHDSGAYERAKRSLQRALAMEPFAPQIHFALGNLLHDMGYLPESLQSYRYALMIEPDMADAHLSVGNLLATLHQWKRAEQYYRQALRIHGESADAHCNLGMVLVECDRSEEAIWHLQTAIRIQPQHAQAHNNLGNAYYVQAKFPEAITSYHHALIIAPDYAEAYANLGNTLNWAGQLQAARGISARALAINPHNAKAHNNLGNILRELGHVTDAIQSFEHALAIDADNAETHLNYSFALLEKGDFAHGWREYEYRWQTKMQGRLPDLGIPQWRGDEQIRGKTLLLYAEQGFGDTIQFIRYAVVLAQRGAAVHAAVPEQLLTLAASCPGVTAAWRLQEVYQMQPRADFICPMMSLPFACGTDLSSIPAQIPYLQASPATTQRWADLLGAALPSARTLCVGLVWSGNPRKHLPLSNAIDRQRSMSFDHIKSLLDTPGVAFFNLQIGNAAPEDTYGKRLIDLTPHIRAFEDTAALISHLDLVISVDTSVAHLAGAVGKPVWMLNRFNTCWRWMTEGSDSLWYPTMTIYRQPSPGAWQAVIDRVCADLLSLSERAAAK